MNKLWIPRFSLGLLRRIENGADVNAKNYERKPALDFAIKYKRTEIADILRKHGGKTGAEKAEGK